MYLQRLKSEKSERRNITRAYMTRTQEKGAITILKHKENDHEHDRFLLKKIRNFILEC
ncbi:unnamed protein product [Amoebophrya sp. A25]|nr:unnamed protein product [Amoebophrya sp. A25]|eukprot:GSA25T00017176001.1